jgi:hypothetical protein
MISEICNVTTCKHNDKQGCYARNLCVEPRIMYGVMLPICSSYEQRLEEHVVKPQQSISGTMVRAMFNSCYSK